MSNELESKVLYNVLRSVSRGGSGSEAAPDSAYIRALEEIGMIHSGYDSGLKPLGVYILSCLENKFDKW